ncbi:cholesterol esterase [Streptomyces griseorubiginosus]|nr:cholesterol esterase [Streptomyces griseorubiginosus]
MHMGAEMASSADLTPGNPESGSSPDPARRGRVRLRRAAVMAVPAVGALAGLAILTAQGALGVNFYISGMPFTVTAKSLDGTGFEQFGALDNMADGSPNAGDTGGQVLVVTSAIKKATLDSLCQSVDLGGTNLLIKAGSGSSKVQATDLTTDSTLLTGDASFNNIEIGNDASTLSKAGVKGPIGVFGQQSDTVHIDNLRQTNYKTTAATFTLPGLRLSFSDSGC